MVLFQNLGEMVNLNAYLQHFPGRAYRRALRCQLLWLPLGSRYRIASRTYYSLLTARLNTVAVKERFEQSLPNSERSDSKGQTTTYVPALALARVGALAACLRDLSV